MAVLPRRALHEQLAVIMGALTKAAVAEICEAVDEGYAALQMEITRSHKENDDLKKKLHLIESIVVRGGGGGGGAATAAETPQRRDGDGGAAAAEPGGGGVTAVVRELPDVVLIKDEDSDTSDSFEEGKKPDADGGAAAAGEAVASTPISRSTKRRWPGSEAGDRKSSSEQPAGKRNVSVYTLDSPRGEAGEAVCSYAAQMDPDVQLVHQECPPLPPSADRQAAYFGSSALMEAQSGPEQDLSLTWTRASKGQVTFGQFHQNENPDGDAFGIRLISVSGSASTDSQPSESSGSAFEYDSSDVMSFYRDQPGAGGRGKRFVCSICGRTYATSQNLDVHMRIHTGERPFSCDQCGKKFTQSAHLKSHLSVHSGERPYACAVCARSFIVKYSLKLHMRKCHPNVPSQ